jgi:predicted O-methyltransferase YrrM
LGIGALTFAQNAPNAIVYTIDLPDDTAAPTNLNETDKNLVSRSRNRIGEAFAGHPNIRQIRADSQSLLLKEITAAADLIFVDGGHSHEIVKADTENALEVVNKGGAIVWDDYWWFYPDVVRYLNELDLPLRRVEHTNLVIYRHGCP